MRSPGNREKIEGKKALHFPLMHAFIDSFFESVSQISLPLWSWHSSYTFLSFVSVYDTKPLLGRCMGPPSQVTPTLLPFRIYCPFLFCSGFQLAGIMPIVYLLVFFSSAQWNRILRAAFVSSGVSKQTSQRQTFRYYWSLLPPSLPSV